MAITRHCPFRLDSTDAPVVCEGATCAAYSTAEAECAFLVALQEFLVRRSIRPGDVDTGASVKTP